MKIFLTTCLILIIAISAAVYGFKYWQKQAGAGNAPVSLQQSLTGVLEPVPSISDYSDVIVNGSQTVGVTSNTINLRPFENKKVKVMGEYSGTTMYADSVVIVP